MIPKILFLKRFWEPNLRFALPNLRDRGNYQPDKYRSYEARLAGKRNGDFEFPSTL
jgi:hypothetical protein